VPCFTTSGAFCCPTRGELQCDKQLDHKLLDNSYGRRRYGEKGFRLCAETLDHYPSIFEILFIEGNEVGITVLVPKAAGIDRELLALCEQFSSPSQGLSS